MKLTLKPPSLIVFQITQSPMNASRWLITLTCGHELWVTRARKPTSKRYRCLTCYAADARVTSDELAQAERQFRPS